LQFKSGGGKGKGQRYLEFDERKREGGKKKNPHDKKTTGRASRSEAVMARGKGKGKKKEGERHPVPLRGKKKRSPQPRCIVQAWKKGKEGKREGTLLF